MKRGHRGILGVGLLVVAAIGPMAAKGQDRAGAKGGERDHLMAIGHGLKMAIEGYTLQELAGRGGAGSATLLQHSRAAFAASDRLLRRGGQDLPEHRGEGGRREAAGGERGENGGIKPLSGPPEARFLIAANEYAGALRRLAPQGAVPDVGQNRGGAAGGDGGRDSVALVNHAVGEVVNAFALNQSLAASGASDSPAARQLRQHAREMDREGRQTLEALASRFSGQGQANRDTNTTPGPAASQRATVPNLVRQANEIARALRDLAG